MQTITRLEQQKKNKERVNVYLDGEFAFGLNMLDAARLQTGQQLTDDEIAGLRQQDAIVKAVDTAINLLSYRPRSTHEIRQRLHKKALGDTVIDAAIDKLVQLGYLDDEAFARFWIADRNRFRPRGGRALRYELRSKGIPDSIIDAVLADMSDDNQAAYQAAQGRVRRMRGCTQHEFKQKIGAFLQRRGFPYESANQALARLIEELQADDPAFFADDTPKEWD